MGNLTISFVIIQQICYNLLIENFRFQNLEILSYCAENMQLPLNVKKRTLVALRRKISYLRMQKPTRKCFYQSITLLIFTTVFQCFEYYRVTENAQTSEKTLLLKLKLTKDLN